MTTAVLTPVDDTALIEAATRRQFLTALAAAGLLTGCAAGADDTGPATAGAGYPRTVEHSGGEVTLDAPPERVFLGSARAALDDLLGIGIIPAALALGSSEALPSWALQRGAGDILRLDSTTLDLETLAALDAIEATPLFAALPAVADGRYVRLDTEESQALLGASSLGVPYALDALTRALS